MKLNNKGMSIIEITVTFALIMAMVIGMLTIVMNYREQASVSLEKLRMDTFKNTLTKDIHDDVSTLGVSEINTGGDCNNVSGLNKCINIVFKDGSQKILGTSYINSTDIKTIENKYIYYDGDKYKLKDDLPDTIPQGRNPLDLQTIVVDDSEILETTTAVSKGSDFNIYTVKIGVSHFDFEEDFGIHFVVSNDNIFYFPDGEFACTYEVGYSWNFEYKGSPEEFVVPCNGTYKLEVYGAQGGSLYGTGGLGGYSVGNKTLNSNEKLYVNVGNQPLDTKGGYNGGGAGFTDDSALTYISGGGGATDISYNNDRIIIAGGGGAGAQYHTEPYSILGGTGGGLTAGNIYYAQYGGVSESLNTGAGQSFSGLENKDVYDQNIVLHSDESGNANIGGGGGYFGGAYYDTINRFYSGAGGSGYIGGVVDGVTTAGLNEGNGRAIITLLSY